MTPANRVRLIVAVLAVVASAIVVGVVYATRQDPPQPSARCKQGMTPYIVPGAPTANVGAVRDAFARGPKGAAQALEPLALQATNDPVVQFNYGTALFCAGFVVDAESAYRAAKKAGRNTFYEIQADAVLHPQFFDQGYPPFVSESRDPLLVQGEILQRAGHEDSA